MPTFMQPSALRQGIVIALDEDGNALKTLHDQDGKPVYMITSVEQVGDQLYLGSLEAPQIVRLPAPSMLRVDYTAS